MLNLFFHLNPQRCRYSVFAFCLLFFVPLFCCGFFTLLSQGHRDCGIRTKVPFIAMTLLFARSMPTCVIHGGSMIRVRVRPPPPPPGLNLGVRATCSTETRKETGNTRNERHKNKHFCIYIKYVCTKILKCTYQKMEDTNKHNIEKK